MAVTLPLACKACGWRLDLRSDQPMPCCAVCNGRMGPAGRLVQDNQVDEGPIHPFAKSINCSNFTEVKSSVDLGINLKPGESAIVEFKDSKREVLEDKPVEIEYQKTPLVASYSISACPTYYENNDFVYETFGDVRLTRRCETEEDEQRIRSLVPEVLAGRIRKLIAMNWSADGTYITWRVKDICVFDNPVI